MEKHQTLNSLMRQNVSFLHENLNKMFSNVSCINSLAANSSTHGHGSLVFSVLILGVLDILLLVGNIVVLACLLQKPARWTPPDRILYGLSIVGFLIGFINLPGYLVTFVSGM